MSLPEHPETAKETKMEILAISDLHGQLPPWPDVEVDLIVIAGDITPHFEHDPVPRALSWLRRDFTDWIHRTPAYVPVFAVWGNHDFVGEQHRDPVPSVNMMTDESTFVNEVRLHGTPWVPNLKSWAFFGTERMLEARAELIADNVQILISHGPPYGMGDKNTRGTMCGDPSLNKAIERADIPLVICGHIHEDRGVHKSTAGLVVNVAAVDEWYELYEKPWTLIHWNSGKVDGVETLAGTSNPP